MIKNPRIFQLWRKSFGKEAKKWRGEESRCGLSCDWKKNFTSLDKARKYAALDYSSFANVLTKFNWKEEGKDNYVCEQTEAFYWIALLDIEE